MTIKHDYNRVMVTVRIHELKAKLSHFLQLARNGQTIIVMNRSVQVAEIKPPTLTKDRKLGLAKKMYPDWTPNYDAFLEPMSKEDLALWEGPLMSKS